MQKKFMDLHIKYLPGTAIGAALEAGWPEHRIQNTRHLLL